MPSDHFIMQTAKIISDIYEDEIRENLNAESKKINEILKNTFAKYDKSFDLTYTNSVYSDKKIYSFIYRVKEKVSLYEKLNRKNIIFNLIDTLSIKSIKDIEDKKITIIDEIKKFDDTVGFRILCDLENDVKSCYDLIKEHSNQFTNIKFLNIADQPKTMQNGHLIYKLECIYEDIFFELQIKSKLNSAWADMEHDLYYKHNKIDIVKEINKLSFNHVGLMLKDIDTYMYELRKMNAGNINTKEINNLTAIEDRYASELKNVISDNFTFDFSQISQELTYLVGDRISTKEVTNHLKTFLERILSDKKKRHNTWELIILEAIYYEIYAESETKYINDLFDFICNSISKDMEIEYKNYMRTIYTEAINSIKGSFHLSSTNNYESLYNFYIILQEIYIEDEETYNDKIKTDINQYFGLEYFNIDNDINIDEEILIHVQDELKAKFRVDGYRAKLEKTLKKLGI